MTTKSERRKNATVLVINDLDNTRTTIVSRVYACQVGAVVAPTTMQELSNELASRLSPFSLIILDYDLEGWGLRSIEPVRNLLHAHSASNGAPLVVLSGFGRYARFDPLLAGIEVIDWAPGGIDSMEDLITRYIG